MATALTMSCNTGVSDVAHPSGEWEDVAFLTDKLIWTDGGTGVEDGDDTPSDAELNEASPVIPSVTPYEIPKLFLLDYSDTGQELKEISLAGSDDNRYVLRFYFDGGTGTEPSLEAWDDDAHDSNDSPCLGAGDGADSYIKVVRTTDGSPGASWTGDPLGGSTHKSNMNGGAGALGSALAIYYNIKVVIPVGATASADSPVLTVRWTWL